MSSNWKLLFDDRVEKQLRKLDTESYRRVSLKLRDLVNDPTPAGAKRLHGAKS